MKKIYILATAIFMAVSANAQYDLRVTLDNTGATSSDNPLDLTYTVLNNGATVPAGDTIFLAVLFGTTFYSPQGLTANQVNIIPLTQDLLNGETIAAAVDPISMQDMYDIYLGQSLTGNACVLASVGQDALTNGFSNDATPSDNSFCTAYTVTEVAGVSESNLSEITAYPNPVVTELTINLGNNNVSSINIIDMSGRVLETISNLDSSVTIDMSNYNSGVYFYQVIDNDSAIKTEKFIVTK